MPGEFRPIPPSNVAPLPGERDPGAYFYVCHGDDLVMLCQHGDAARWKNAVAFTADEARKLGMALMAQADAAEQVADEERTK